MAFTKVNNASGSYWQPGLNVTMTMTTGIAINAGALITKTAGAADVALFGGASTDFTTLPIFGVSNQTVAATATSVDVQLLQAGDVVEVDIDEIINTTALTVASGSGTTFVITALKGLGATNDILKSSRWKVIACASGDAVVGSIITATGYTASSGTITFASVGSTGFASSDKVQLLSVSSDYVTGVVSLPLNSTRDNISVVGTPVVAATAYWNVWGRVIGATASGPLGGTADGNKLRVVLLSGCDAPYLYHT